MEAGTVRRQDGGTSAMPLPRRSGRFWRRDRRQMLSPLMPLRRRRFCSGRWNAGAPLFAPTGWSEPCWRGCGCWTKTTLLPTTAAVRDFTGGCIGRCSRAARRQKFDSGHHQTLPHRAGAADAVGGVLGLEKPADEVPYVRVLAATAEGRRLLRQLQSEGVPVLTKPADVAALGEEAQRLFAREAQRTDVFALAYPAAQGGCGSDWRHTPVITG